jgi:hypothetical protein
MLANPHRLRAVAALADGTNIGQAEQLSVDGGYQAVPHDGFKQSGGTERNVAEPLRSVRADECRARHPVDQGPEYIANRAMARNRRTRRMDRRRAHHRFGAAPAARLMSSSCASII